MLLYKYRISKTENRKGRIKLINLKFIKTRRSELGISQQEMAEKLGFKNASTYFKYETGVYSFKAEMIPVLATELKCDMKNFFEN